MPCPKLILDSSDLPPATLHSCSYLSPFVRDFIERAPVAVEDGLLARVFLPPPNYAIRIPGVDLHQPSFASASLTADERGAGATEQIRDNVAGLAAVDE